MMKNSFRNLRHGTKRILSNAKEKIKAPVLIVGSGPSLEDNIETLKKCKKNTLNLRLETVFTNYIQHDTFYRTCFGTMWRKTY
jgi:hypothetical protein